MVEVGNKLKSFAIFFYIRIFIKKFDVQHCNIAYSIFSKPLHATGDYLSIPSAFHSNSNP